MQLSQKEKINSIQQLTVLYRKLIDTWRPRLSGLLVPLRPEILEYTVLNFNLPSSQQTNLKSSTPFTKEENKLFVHLV